LKSELFNEGYEGLKVFFDGDVESVPIFKIDRNCKLYLVREVLESEHHTIENLSNLLNREEFAWF
jgi:hypothetical protein